MNTLSSVIDQVVQDGLLALSINRHQDFLGALRHSLSVNPQTYTSSTFDPFGFSQRELYELRVLLVRPLAFQWITASGASLSQSAFDRKTSYEAFTRTFGREPWLISVRPRIMALTYTEWSYLALGEVPAFPLPDLPASSS